MTALLPGLAARLDGFLTSREVASTTRLSVTRLGLSSFDALLPNGLSGHGSGLSPAMALYDPRKVWDRYRAHLFACPSNESSCSCPASDRGRPWSAGRRIVRAVHRARAAGKQLHAMIASRTLPGWVHYCEPCGCLLRREDAESHAESAHHRMAGIALPWRSDHGRRRCYTIRWHGHSINIEQRLSRKGRWRVVLRDDRGWRRAYLNGHGLSLEHAFVFAEGWLRRRHPDVFQRFLRTPPSRFDPPSSPTAEPISAPPSPPAPIAPPPGSGAWTRKLAAKLAGVISQIATVDPTGHERSVTCPGCHAVLTWGKRTGSRRLLQALARHLDNSGPCPLGSSSIPPRHAVAQVRAWIKRRKTAHNHDAPQSDPALFERSL